LRSDDHDRAQLALAASVATSTVEEPTLEEAEEGHSSEAAAKVLASPEMALGEGTSKLHAATSLPDQPEEAEVRAKLPKEGNICFLCLRQEAFNLSPYYFTNLAMDVYIDDAVISTSERMTDDAVLLRRG